MYKTNRLFPISFYRTNQQSLPVLSNYKYKSWSFSIYLVYEHQHYPGFGKDTICKPILDYLIDVKLLLHKELNKPNIPQELECILVHKPDQESFFLLAEKLKTKAIPTDGQECTALPVKKLF